MPTPTILIYGADWCGDCRRTRRFLTEHDIPFDWINIEKDQQGEQLVLKINKGMRSIPTLIFQDGSILVEPTVAQLARKLDISLF